MTVFAALAGLYLVGTVWVAYEAANAPDLPWHD